MPTTGRSELLIGKVAEYFDRCSGFGHGLEEASDVIGITSALDAQREVLLRGESAGQLASEHRFLGISDDHVSAAWARLRRAIRQ